MRKAAVCMAGLLLLSGCGSMTDEQKRGLAGAVIGAGVGALVGSSVAVGPGPIWVGAAVGGATGGLVASLISPQGCFIRNARGEVWRVPCEQAIPREARACYFGTVRNLEEIDCRGQPGPR